VISAVRFSFLEVWILLCAYLSAAGWILSFFGALTPLGYFVVLLCGGVGLLFGRSRCMAAYAWRFRVGKLRWRLRHCLPALFFLYALLTLVSGLLCAPTNYDALNYRLPRVLHWLAAHRWHWIETSNLRLNILATGSEWLSAPVLALASTDRFLFLINTVCFLFLPGLVFGVFAGLGVGRKVAWSWMWLLPTGYCFVLQAGGIGNDLFSAVFCLAAIQFALRARVTRNIRHVWLAILSAALMTGAKASNLPLLLPCALALLPSLKLALERPVAGASVLLLSAAASFAPTALANAHFAGDWGGDPLNVLKVHIDGPVYGLAGNSLQLLVGNAMPPVMPFIGPWNRAVDRLMQTAPLKTLSSHYPRFKLNGYRELAQEEGAGLGLGLCALLVISILWAWRCHSSARAGSGAPRGNKLGFLVCLGGWVALLACMANLGSEAAPRLVAAYYPLVFASALFLPGQTSLVQDRWWRALAFVAGLSALPALILSPARPLWPALTACHWLQDRLPNNGLLGRALITYEVYRQRNDCLAPLRKYIPAGSTAVGFVAGEDEPEASLWRPFGSRRVVPVTAWNADDVLGKRVQVVIVSVQSVNAQFGRSVDQWLLRNHLRVLGREQLVEQVLRGPQEWLVVQVDSGGS
jgi:hypothetical protein